MLEVITSSPQSSCRGGRRSRLVAERRRLASSRAAFAARLGLVRFRGFGTASAAATTSRSRSVAASRFRSWLRGLGGHDPQPTLAVERVARRAEQPCALLVGQRRRARDVPPDLDAGGRGVDVLTARTAGARGAVVQLGEREQQVGSDLEVAVGQGGK